MTVRGSSTSFGSRASKARLDRAFLGLLIMDWASAFYNAEMRIATHTTRSMAVYKTQYVVQTTSGLRGYCKNQDRKPEVRITGRVSRRCSTVHLRLQGS